MSRSFERKVEKNRKKFNVEQQKKGVKPAGTGIRGEGTVFKGRNIMLPVFLAFLGIVYAAMGMAGGSQQVNLGLYIVTVALYFILGAVIFFRKPYLRINRGRLYTSKFNRDRSLDAGQIAKITWSKNAITIVTKTKEPNWTFSRSRNLFDTEAMGESLRQYAAVHGVVVEKK